MRSWSVLTCGILALSLAACGRDAVGPATPPVDRPDLPPIRTEMLTVGAGKNFSCALRTDGVAFCWGANDIGQLGDGTRTTRMTPVEVAGGHRFSQISVGDQTACGIIADGSAWCWGSDKSGMLGSGFQIALFPGSPVPMAVAGDHRFRSIDVGLATACGVAEDGATYCWGSNRLGALGTGSASDDKSTPGAVVNSVSRGFVTVSAAFHTTCALDVLGAVFCWGTDRGTFGNGPDDTPTSMPSFIPSPTPAASGVRLTSVEAGVFYVCGLDTAGKALCWGSDNFTGQQGNGTFMPSTTPTPVVGDHTFVSIDAFDNNRVLETTCAITPAGEAYCWGSNERGQLGGPSGETCGPLGAGLPAFGCSSTPIAVGGGVRFASIAVGLTHVCAVSQDSAIYCWGSNEAGQLGNGSLIDSPVPIAVPPLTAP